MKPLKIINSRYKSVMSCGAEMTLIKDIPINIIAPEIQGRHMACTKSSVVKLSLLERLKKLNGVTTAVEIIRAVAAPVGPQ